MRGKQEYRIDGHWLDSSKCDGFVHTAKRKEGLCYACRKPIKIGEKYVIVNYYPVWGDPVTVHLDEYVQDHGKEGVILGAKRDSYKRIECQRFRAN
jgi:hypothetical protein